MQLKNNVMMEERVYFRIKGMIEGRLLPESTAIWLGDFQESEGYLLRKKLIEKVWIEGVLFYKFN